MWLVTATSCTSIFLVKFVGKRYTVVRYMFEFWHIISSFGSNMISLGMEKWQNQLYFSIIWTKYKKQNMALWSMFKTPIFLGFEAQQNSHWKKFGRKDSESLIQWCKQVWFGIYFDPSIMGGTYFSNNHYVYYFPRCRLVRSIRSDNHIFNDAPAK